MPQGGGVYQDHIRGDRLPFVGTGPEGEQASLLSSPKPAASRPGPIGAAAFKARCLELADRVRETGAEYIITKHGVQVAKLVPYTPVRTRGLFGSMKGTVLHYERPLDPLDDDYDVNRS